MARILLVEDNNTLRDLFRSDLKKAGHKVVAVAPENGDFIAATLTALTERCQIDILLTDINLGRTQTGFELIKNILQGERARPQKIIIMSADPSTLKFQEKYAPYADLQFVISGTFLKGEPSQNLTEIIAAVVAQND